MDWYIEVAAGILRATGNKDLADWLKNAPAKLGEEIGAILQQGLKNRGAISDTAVNRLQTLSKNNPAEPVQRSNDLLDEYLVDLNELVSASAPLKAIALRGFFHDKNCLTVWYFSDELTTGFKIDEPLSKGDQRTIWVMNSGIDIFVGDPVDDEGLRQLNLEIEKDAETFLKKAEAYRAKVRSLTKNEVTLTVRHGTSRRENDEAKAIVNPEENIDECFRTLGTAMKAQSERFDVYQKTTAARRKKS